MSDQNNPMFASELAANAASPTERNCPRPTLSQEPEKISIRPSKTVRIEGALSLNLGKQVPRSLNRPGDQVRERLTNKPYSTNDFAVRVFPL